MQYPVNNKRLSRTKAAAFVVLFLMISGLSARAQADDSLASLRAFWSNKLPDTTQLKDSYSNLRTRPFGHEDLAFSLLVPSGWKETQVTVKTEQLEADTLNWIPLALLLSPEEGENRASIQVAYVRLDLEMNLCDYVDQHLKKNNYVVLLRRQVVYNKREAEEALVKTNGQVARLTFSRHGDRIFAVICSSPESEYPRHAQAFAAAAISFSVEKKSSRPFVNPMKTFSSTKTPRLKFRYPQDWELEEILDQPAGQTGVELRIAAPDEKGQMLTFGYLFIQGYDKSTGKTPKDVLGAMRKTLENKPVTFQKITLRADLEPRQEDPFYKLERWDASIQGTPVEAAMLVLPHRADMLALSLVTPHREDNLLAWMHCWRIFEIVASDLVEKAVSIAHVKNLAVPSKQQIISLVSNTMESFSQAVQKQDFSSLYNDTSSIVQIQSSAQRLRSAFSGFSRQPEIPLIGQHQPVLTMESGIDQEGMLNVEGYFPTVPEATTFHLAYRYENNLWKLLSLKVAMRKDLPAP